MENLRAQPQSPIVCRPVTAVRVIVRQVVIRQHAARSAIEDSAARFSARAPQQEPRNGNANRGSWLLGEFFKLFESQVQAIHKRDRPASGYRHALFELILAKPGRQDFVANFFVLYGAPTVAGSLKELKPKEGAVVRLWGGFSGSGFQDASNPVLFPVPGLRLKVGFVMYAPGDPRFKFAPEEFSQNSLPTTLLPPLRD